MDLKTRLLATAAAAAVTMTALGGGALAADESGTLSLSVNGQDTGIQVTPIEEDYLVPVRQLAEYLGYEVAWHAEDSTVTLDSGTMHSTLTLGENRYIATTSLEGMVGMTAPFTLACAPYAVDGTTYAPLELFVVLMGNPADALTRSEDTVELRTESSSAHLPNPWREQPSLEALSDAVGFPVALPQLPKGYEAVDYQDLSGSLAQVRFSNGTDTLLYRVSRGSEDNSGDYTVYPEEQSMTVGDTTVTCRGRDGAVFLALWTTGEYTCSLSSQQGLTVDAVRTAVA